MSTKNAKISTMNIAETMACVAFAEEGQACTLGAPSGVSPETSERHHHDWATTTQLEKDLACVSFLERDQACPLGS